MEQANQNDKIYLSDEMEKQLSEEMLAQLQDYQSWGITITIEGKELPLDEIALICAVRECGQYMGDFIQNAEGKLSEVCFTHVKYGIK